MANLMFLEKNLKYTCIEKWEKKRNLEFE